MGDAVGEDARLSRAGARDHQKRALRAQHRFALLRVERVEKGVVGRDRVRHYRTALTGGRLAVGSAEVPTKGILPAGVGGKTPRGPAPERAGPRWRISRHRTRTVTVGLVPPALAAVAAATARSTYRPGSAAMTVA